jgi:polyhydroxybutyrate depolymerase
LGLVKRTTLALCLGAIALAAPAQAAAASPCAVEPPSGDLALQVQSGGVARQAVLHVPPIAQRGRRLALVVALHGAGGDGPQMEAYSGFDVVADRDDFAVVYPSAGGSRPFWNYTGSPSRRDDVRFIGDLVGAIRGQLCIAPRRVYATGISNGGSMAARLGCAMSGTFAAIAPVAGSYSRQPQCQPDRPVSVLEIHGKADASVPYSTVRPYLNGWVARDACSRTPVSSSIDARTRRLTWNGCSAGTRVEHIAVRGGVHQWPGGFPSSDSTFSAEWEVWGFLRGLRLTDPRTPGRASL